MKIVAISGKMHSGKSYVADHLVKNHGYTRVSFAAALKNDIVDMGFNVANVYNKPPWMRELMQKYGQARRAEDPDHWVKVLHDLLLDFRAEEGPYEADEIKVVIDDMRFPNEADMLLNFEDDYGEDVELVRLERAGYSRDGIAGAGETSETALDDYPEFTTTYTVESGDLEGLQRCADEIAWRVDQYGRASSTSPEGAAE